nr:hypothetical protein [Effusibacillus pohliae]
MLKWVRGLLSGLAVFTLAASLLPATVHAYSYGDPNEEAVAEAYKKMAAKLNQSPPDFAGAQAAFEPVKEELDMHMGPEPAATVLEDLRAKNKDGAMSAMQKILVLNIARRFASIEQDFQNYKQAKMLMAKANATYEALSPEVKQKDPALDGTLRQEFQKALDSLGNPGLFGVGVKQPDPNAFKASKEKILKSLQDRFGLKSLEVGHFKEGSDPSNEQNRNKQAGTDFSEIRNWLPIAVIVLVIAGIVVYTRRKMRR